MKDGTPEPAASERVSATVICFNEEKKIEGCLRSLMWADEIVVLDSGSRDRTVEIARKFTKKVFSIAWVGYGEQKNKAIEMASFEWILSIDADERVCPDLAAEVREVVETKGGYEGFLIPRKTLYCGRLIKHCGWYPDLKLRLFKKGKGRWTPGLHERVVMDGHVGRLRGDIIHESFDTVGEHIETIENFTSIAALELKKTGRQASVFDILMRPPGTFLKMYFLKMGFLDGFEGFLISVLSSLHVFLKYSKLRLLEKGEFLK